MSERSDIERAIEALESRRAELGDVVVDTALAPLREKLALLETPEAAGERRVVTILFCDVTGSTALAATMDPEAWTGIMNAVFARMNQAVDRYGGTVARLMGDAILAFFGAPAAHENDPERAVLAGLAILENIRPLREQIKQDKGLDFNVRVGINTGMVVAGLVGSEVRGEYTAMGDAVNLAARMEQTAAPGTVQITAETYRSVRPLFDVEDLGGIIVKGKSDPVQAFRVLKRKTTPGRVRGLEERGLRSPLVGRDAELAILRERIDRLQAAKEGGIVLIFGEAGLGKTTLVGEARRRAANGDLRWLEGNTLSFGQTLSYWPFREMLWAFAGISEEDDEDTTWDKLEQSVTRLCSEQGAEYLPYLASLLALDVREPYREKVAYLDAEALSRQVYLSSRRFFEQLALDRPLVLVFEDLHWMDDASGRLLAHLMPLVERAPLLVIGLSRPDPDAAGDRIAQQAGREHGEWHTKIMLKRLPPEDSRTLVQNLLAVDDLPAHLRQKIVDQAGGNPFFLEEIIRTLIDTGAVERDKGNGRWRATKAIETLQLPDTVQGIVIARVDRLAEEVKQVLRTASVVGRSFLYRLLREVMQLDRELEQELVALQEIDLIREKQQLPELEYTFKHALAQEAVYESILLETRHRLHRSVAETIEALFAERLEEFYGLLAYHYARAEASEQALEYLLKAGDRAGQVAADAEALAYYRQALSAYEGAFGDRWDPLQRARLERKMGQAFFRRGEHAQAQEHLNRALTLLGRPLPSSRWAVRRAILAQVLQQALIRIAPWLMRRPESPDDFAGEREQLLVYEALGWMDVVGNQERFMLETLRLLNLWERIGRPAGHTFGFGGLTVAFDLVGLYGLARRYLRLNMQAAREHEQPLSMAYAHQVLAVHYSWVGRPEKTLEHGAVAVQYHKASGFLRGLGQANFMMSETLIYQGHLERARALANEVLSIGREGGDAQLEAWGLLFLGYWQRVAGEQEKAIATLRQCEGMARSLPDYQSLVQILAQIGQSHLDLGRLEPGMDSIHEAERAIREHNVIGTRFASMSRVALARAHLLAAEKEEDGNFKAALALAKRACRDALKITRKYRPFLAEVYRYQGTVDWLTGQEQSANRWWEKSLAIAAEIDQPLEKAMTCLEMGRRQADSGLVERAKAILSDIEARPDLLVPE